MLRQANSSKKDIDFLKKYCDTIQKEGQFHIQKVELIQLLIFSLQSRSHASKNNVHNVGAQSLTSQAYPSQKIFFHNISNQISN